MFRGFGHQSGSKISGNQANVIITHFIGLVIKRHRVLRREFLYMVLKPVEILKIFK